MTLERSTRARITALAVLLLVLVAGVVSGMALDRQLAARRTGWGESGRPGGRLGMDGRNRGFDPRSGDSSRALSQNRDPSQRRPPLIVEQVGLSAAQKAQVDSIVMYYRGQMRALHEEFNEDYLNRYREITQATRDGIKAVLTVEQQTAYDSLLVESDRRRESRNRDSVSYTEGGRTGG
jgi:hypothetical protein